MGHGGWGAALLALCSLSSARGAATPYSRSEQSQMLPSHRSGCDACGKNDAGDLSCCSRGGAWHGKCGDGAEHTWEAGFNVCNGATQESAPSLTAPSPKDDYARFVSLACDACGKNDAGDSSCCSRGGAWHGKCGNGAEHTWEAGFNVCNGAAQDAASDPQAFGVGCKLNSDCHDAQTPYCVVQADGDYSQCISCSDDDFAHACPFWVGLFLEAAEKGCNQDCAKLAKTTMADLECNSDHECHSPTNACVLQGGGEFAQCVTCEKVQFLFDCQVWAADFVKAAEEKCSMECVTFPPPSPPAPGLDCYTHADCANDLVRNKCVVRETHAYALCISCSTAAFQSDCPFWEETDFLPLAEKVCHQKCNCPKTEHKLKKCTGWTGKILSTEENEKRSQRRRSPVNSRAAEATNRSRLI